MKNLRNLVILEALNLGVNESVRTVCPMCGGGSDGEKSFSITRVPAGLLYNCYRGKCNGTSGFVGDIPQRDRLVSNKSNKIRPFKGMLVAIPGAIWKSRFEPYGLPYNIVVEQGIKYAPVEHRLYMPIYNWQGYQIGENLKACEPGTKPKALVNTWSATEPLLHFPLVDQVFDKVCLVEDQISAIKIRTVGRKFGVTACALMGTNLSYDGLMLLKQKVKVNKLLIFLDGDANEKAIKLYNSIQHIINCTVLMIKYDQDPKDIPVKDLEDMLI